MHDFYGDRCNSTSCFQLIETMHNFVVIIEIFLCLFRSLKAVSQESFNNTIKLINGVSALILTFLPGKAKILEGVQGWELRPTLRAPRLPQWMEE